MPETPEQLARKRIDALLIWLKACAVIQHLSITNFAKRALPILHAEQMRTVAEAKRLSMAEDLEAMVSPNLQRAARLRQSILQKAFTGELVV